MNPGASSATVDFAVRLGGRRARHGLYHRLFTYRERENRSPLEDFLTEALADLLNRFPESLARDAAAFLLNDRPEAVDALKRVWPDGAQARWRTQGIIDGGRLVDLVMEINARPVMVVENKIRAGFQEHRLHPCTSGDRATQNQLATYGKWLSREADVTWGGAIVLLTHWTPEPLGFINDAASYGSRYRTVVRWAELSRWLANESRSAEFSRADWAKLSSELVGFLKEQNMDSELATGQDWAALQVYVASADRVRNSVQRIWERASAVWRPICQQADYALEISTEYGCIWKFRYLARSDLRDSYLAVGLRYPDLSEYWHDVTPDVPHLFVELASDRDNPAIANLAMPTGWEASPSTWIAKRPLRDLPADANGLVAEAETWVCSRIAEVAKALG